MIRTFGELEAAVLSLNTYRRGDRRAPHKPLLFLYALGQFLADERNLQYENVAESLTKLLHAYAPPVKNRHQPDLPYWHLTSDGVWSISGAGQLDFQKSGRPTIPSLRATSGRFPDDVAAVIQANPEKLAGLASKLLEQHFPESLHEEILSAVGLDLVRVSGIAEAAADYKRRKRDPRFRERVLRAYEHRCAVTGFRAALGGTYFGTEAAHVQWHAYDGPDTVANGLSLEPTLHKLFDAGAWTLTDDRRVLVSADFTGSDSAVERLRQHHGRKIRAPLAGESQIDISHIRWHREADEGGVFRMPALGL